MFYQAQPTPTYYAEPSCGCASHSYMMEPGCGAPFTGMPAMAAYGSEMMYGPEMMMGCDQCSGGMCECGPFAAPAPEAYIAPGPAAE
jgi:hypothetical protein